MNNKVFPAIRTTSIVLFCTLIFIYITAFINPVLTDFIQQPLFLKGKFFLSKFTEYQGGMTEYISLYLSQFFAYKIWGGLIISLLVTLSVVLTGKILEEFYSKTISFLLQFIPGLFLIMIHGKYNSGLSVDLIYVTATVFSLAYLKVNKIHAYIKIAALPVMSVFLFWFSGSTSLIFFTIVIIAIALKEKNIKSGLITIAIQIITSLVSIYIISRISAHFDFITLIKGALLKKINPDNYWIQALLYSSLPILIIVSLLIKSKASKKSEKENKKFLLFGIPVVILAFTIASILVSFDKKGKEMIMMNYYAKNSQWDEVLKISAKLPVEDRKVIFQINRALYHKGKLLDEAFSYPQYWGENGLVLTTQYSKEVLGMCSDLYYDMGHIKGSLHWAYEALTKYDNSPDILKRIALSNLILGDYKTAEKYTSLISGSVIHKKWAEKYLPYAEEIKPVENDAVLSGKRKLVPEDHFFSNTSHPISDLYNLISQNPENKMAFEYYIMNAMLIHDLANLVKQIKGFEKLQYNSLPRHVEEALMLFMTLNDQYKPDLGKYKISKETIQRFTQFSKIIMKHRGNSKAAQADLSYEFKDTYWYYIQYISPITTKREFKEK
jgi:hypothetical protein